MTTGTSAIVVAPGDGVSLQGPVGGPLLLALRGSQTGGRVTALENIVAPGEGPPLHTHDEQDEIWFVVEGDLRFRLEGDVVAAPAGSWAFVPRGTAHCFQNVGSAPARILVLFTPAGMEAFFERFSELTPDDVSPEMFQKLGSDQGMTVVGPPLAKSHPR